MKGVLPWLVRCTCRADTIDFCPAFATLVSPIQFNYYAPMIYTAPLAPCIMFWMRAYPLRGEVGGGWTREL
jgi:hypothetical protein